MALKLAARPTIKTLRVPSLDRAAGEGVFLPRLAPRQVPVKTVDPGRSGDLPQALVDAVRLAGAAYARLPVVDPADGRGSSQHGLFFDQNHGGTQVLSLIHI